MKIRLWLIVASLVMGFGIASHGPATIHSASTSVTQPAASPTMPYET